MFRKLIGLAAILLLLQGGVVQGEIISDLTEPGSSVWINDALFWVPKAADGSGTGVYNPFLRIQKDDVEQGYNTDGKDQPFDVKDSESLLLTAVPRLMYRDVEYLQFSLDINEQNSAPLLTLEELQVFVSESATVANYDTTARTLDGRSAKYDLDSGLQNRAITLDFDNFPGSGWDDLVVMIPRSIFPLFPVDNKTYYVNLFSKFGDPDGPDSDGIWESGDGFEEWATRTLALVPPPGVEPRPNPVPEPGSMVLLLGLLLTGGGIGAIRRRR